MTKLKRFALLTIVLVVTTFTLGIQFSPAVQAAQSSGIGQWKITGSMHDARSYHTATLLKNGLVLVAGGWDGSQYTPNAELYNPATGRWTPTSRMNVARVSFTATLLKNGKVLVAGGIGNGVEPVALASAELYNPSTGNWTLTGRMHDPRESPTATLLKNGKVLVAGGYTNSTSALTPTASAEIYDPSTGTWSLIGSMSEARVDHTATLLRNGKVLVAGGHTDNSLGGIATAEVYNPGTGVWSPTASMHFGRRAPTATLLNDGKVLVAGGADVNNVCCVATTEVYNSRTGTWSETGVMTDPRGFHTATLLKNGQVLVVGGQDVKSIGHYGSNTAEVYNPHTGKWTATPNMHFYRLGQTETLLCNGKVLVAGGGDLTPITSAELFTD